eukprot:1143202-Pelagomonas_calceolata.AAC.4
MHKSGVQRCTEVAGQCVMAFVCMRHVQWLLCEHGLPAHKHTGAHQMGKLVPEQPRHIRMCSKSKRSEPL